MGTIGQAERELDLVFRWSSILIAALIVFAFVFIVTIAGPRSEQQRKECEDKDGVIVGQTQTCIKKDSIL